MLSLHMTLNECAVTVEFDWFGDEPDWDGMTVMALLPSVVAPEGKHYVKINDILSEDDWHKIESEIYWNEDTLKREAIKNEY